MKTVISQDGTRIAFDQSGQGPALILVGGAFEHRALPSETALLAASPLLNEHFTVFHYDRRGRGASGDTQPFAPEREIEDIAALIDSAGGSAYLSGISSGAGLVLEAALALGRRVPKIALYEPPYNDDPAARQAWRTFRQQLAVTLAEGRHGDAVGLFMMLLGMPEDHLAGMRQHPMWAGFEAVAPTIAYDAAVMGAESAIPADRAAQLQTAALVMDGSDTEFPFIHATVAELAKILPHGQHQTLLGQTHQIQPEALAPVLIEFFNADARV